MENEVLLQMTGISKTFPGVKALRNVSFSVNRGEVMGLMGENGAGKSTLIKIITGYYRRDAGSGSAIFDGKEINPKDTLDAQHIGISTIFQELNLSPFLSVAENIYLGNPPKKNGLIDWKAMYAEARKAMIDLGVDIDVTAPLNEQSTAIQQMVSIARALSIDTKILIMDEATSSLEIAEVDILFGVVRQLKNRGISTIFITHKLDEIYKICDRITILKDGEFIACESIGDLPKLRLISLMIGRDASELVKRHKEYDPSVFQNEVLCEIRDIRKANHRLNGISLQIHKGEVLGLAGLLGSGRTETAKVIFGDDQHYEGEVFMNMQAVHFQEPSGAIAKGLAYCSEDRKVEGIFPYMNIQDNITMPILDRLSKSGILNKKKTAGNHAGIYQEDGDQDAIGHNQDQGPERRQPAEGHPVALARNQARFDHPRRTNTRHRCRRQR